MKGLDDMVIPSQNPLNEDDGVETDHGSPTAPAVNQSNPCNGGDDRQRSLRYSPHPYESLGKTSIRCCLRYNFRGAFRTN